MFHFSFYFEGWAEVFPGFAVVLLCLGLGIHSWNHMGVTLPEVLPPFPVPLFLLNPVLRISSLITYRSRNHTLSIVYLKNCKPQRVGFFWVGFLVGWFGFVWVFLWKLDTLNAQKKCSGSESFATVVHLKHFSIKYLCLLLSLVCHVHHLRPETTSMYNKQSLTAVRNATEVIGIVFGKAVPYVCRMD